jgi:hypothetical protein
MVCVEWETETVTIHYEGGMDCWDDWCDICDEWEPYDETITRSTGNCLRYEEQTFLGSLRVPQRLVDRKRNR